MTPLEALQAAIDDPGVSPMHHHAVMGRHRREWPVLWAAIDRLLSERPSALDVDAELLAHVILGGSSYPAHREAAERILARLSEPDAGGR